MGALARVLSRLPVAWRAPEMLLSPLACAHQMHGLLPHGRTSSSSSTLGAAAGSAGSTSSRKSSTSSSGGSSSGSPPNQHQQQPQQQYSVAAGAADAAATGTAADHSPSTTAASAGTHAAASAASTINRDEAAKFAALAGQWWDPTGPFAPLHAMNPVRCRFLRAALCSAFGRDARAAAPLAGLRLLDVGCGGGLLAESLARMGAHVTGIDVNQGGIATAEAHAALDPELAGRLAYRTAAAEQLVQEGECFDAVIASEVIEHVASLPAFCSALDGLTRPGGAVAISTLNRTPRSFALAVVAAEYVLRWVPAGTHDWDKFVTPEELAMQMEESTGGRGSQGGAATRPLRMQQLAGMEYNPFTRSWSLGRDTAVNYIALFTKPDREGASEA